MNSTLIWFDLEGIADDGLGYSVSITANNGIPPPNGKLRKKQYSRGAERLSVINSIRQSLSRSGKFGSAGGFGMAEDEKAIKIVARRSVEVRESFRAESSAEELQNWGAMSDQDNDMDIERTAADLKDWSLLGSPAPALTRPGSAVRSSADRGSRDGPKPAKPSGSVSGRSPSPRRKTASPQPPWRQSQSPRFKQPVTKPLNSSQWWASPQSRSAAPSIEVADDAAWLNEIMSSSGEDRGAYRQESMLAADGSQEALAPRSSGNV
jgi:hypothetical protein